MTEFITNEALTFEELDEKFHEKVTWLQACGDLSSGWGADTIDEFKVYSRDLVQIAAEIDIHKVAIQNARRDVETVKLVLKEIEFLSSKLSYMKTNLPQHLPCEIEKNNSLQTCHKPHHNEQSIPTKRNHKEEFENNEIVKQPVKESKIIHIPKVQYITVDEFDAVPKYIRGRIQYDQINRNIDEINAALVSKYTLIKKPRPKMNPLEMSYVSDFKKQINNDCKGLYFIVDSDIKRFSTLKLDPACRNVLTLLRTLKRLKEVRGPGSLLRYCVIT